MKAAGQARTEPLQQGSDSTPRRLQITFLQLLSAHTTPTLLLQFKSQLDTFQWSSRALQSAVASVPVERRSRKQRVSHISNGGEIKSGSFYVDLQNRKRNSPVWERDPTRGSCSYVCGRKQTEETAQITTTGSFHQGKDSNNFKEEKKFSGIHDTLSNTFGLLPPALWLHSKHFHLRVRKRMSFWTRSNGGAMTRHTKLFNL